MQRDLNLGEQPCAASLPCDGRPSIAHPGLPMSFLVGKERRAEKRYVGRGLLDPLWSKEGGGPPLAASPACVQGLGALIKAGQVYPPSPLHPSQNLGLLSWAFGFLSLLFFSSPSAKTQGRRRREKEMSPTGNTPKEATQGLERGF